MSVGRERGAARRRLLFVAPHSLSSGEAITAAHAARAARARGARVRVLASRLASRWLAGEGGEEVEVLGSDLAANQSLFRRAVRELDPHVVVFADYPLLAPGAGGVPLLDELWTEELPALDAALISFDHLGLLRQGLGSRQPALAHLPPLPTPPERMKVLLPCPIHDPGRQHPEGGIPFRYWQPSPAGGKKRQALRKRYLDDSRDLLLFHAVPLWAEMLASIKGLSYYRVLPRILASHLSRVGRRVTWVSVSSGQHLSSFEGARLRLVSRRSMPAAEYDELLAAADLVLTENCFSVTLGKAICAGVPAVAWRNSFVPETLPRSARRGSLGAVVRRMIAAGGDSVFPWLSFPTWSPEAVRALRVLEHGSLTRAFCHLEVFDSDAAREGLHGLLEDADRRAALVARQQEYRREVAELPDAYQAIVGAAA